jgi:hypothetical protein
MKYFTGYINKLLFLLIFFMGCTVQTHQIKAPEGLICELMRNPEKAMITDQQPEFGWIVDTMVQMQTGYQILVASSMEQLEEGKADFWDSKTVVNSQSINIEYQGNALQEKSSYWWKVKIWGGNGKESEYSTPQQFHTSVFNRTEIDWPGQSNYEQLPDGSWVSENRQTAEFTRIAPILFKQIKQDNWIADFGKAAFATLELSVSSEKDGDTLEILLGERMNKTLGVDKNQGSSNIGFHEQKITLKKGTHTYQIEIPPHHSNSPHSQKLAPFYPEVLPFRYVEINGQALTVNSITQLALFYPFDDNAASFSSSDSELNKVWDLCKYTLKATPFLGLYADGNRERMPYEADAYIQQLGHTCVDREYAVARYTTDFLIYHSSWPTEWQMHSVLMAWEDYMQTGNSELLATRYNDLKAKTLLALAEYNGLISTQRNKLNPEFLKSIYYNGKTIKDIVDWPQGTPTGEKQARNAGPTPEGERDGYVFTDFNTVVNAFHYRTLVLMSAIAETLNKQTDNEFFGSQALKVKHSFQENFFDAEQGVYIDGIGTKHASLHANMFPLAFGLVPEEHTESVVNFIKSKGMACSVYGAQHLLDALFNAGEAGYALSLMTSADKRSWLNMIRVGSTMTTEAWDEYYKPNLTWNHAWGSAPANIIPRRLMGIQALEPAFSKFRILPQPGDLKEVQLKMPTIRGNVEIDFKNSNNSWNLVISVPGNSEAELWLPTSFSEVAINKVNPTILREEKFAGKSYTVFLIKSGTNTILANSK